MQARYTIVTSDEMDKFMSLSEDEMPIEIERLKETHEYLNLGEAWDGLHFILTGESASSPLDDDPISDAIVGYDVLNEDVYTASTPNRVIFELVEILENIDFEQLYESFTPSELLIAEIYPQIWDKEDKKELFRFLHQAFKQLLEFYRRVAESGNDVIVSVH